MEYALRLHGYVRHYVHLIAWWFLFMNLEIKKFVVVLFLTQNKPFGIFGSNSDIE